MTETRAVAATRRASRPTAPGTIAIGQTKTCTDHQRRPGRDADRHQARDQRQRRQRRRRRLVTLNSGGANDSPDNFAGAESPGTTVTLDAGSYSVRETRTSGYTASSRRTAPATIASGETKTCTVTNDDQAGTLTVIKHVINDNGGTAPRVSSSPSTRVGPTTRPTTSPEPSHRGPPSRWTPAPTTSPRPDRPAMRRATRRTVRGPSPTGRARPAPSPTTTSHHHPLPRSRRPTPPASSLSVVRRLIYPATNLSTHSRTG